MLLRRQGCCVSAEANGTIERLHLKAIRLRVRVERLVCANKMVVHTDKRGGDAASGEMNSNSNLKYRTPGNKCSKHEPETCCCSGHKIPGKRGNFGPPVKHAGVSGASFRQVGVMSCNRNAVLFQHLGVLRYLPRVRYRNSV